MATVNSPRFGSFKNKTAASNLNNRAVKLDADGVKVAVCTAATDKAVGIAQTSGTLNADDAVEVALPGGGAKALLAGTVAAGDMLEANAQGAFIVAATTGARVIAMAEEAGVTGDIIAVSVIVAKF